MANSVYGINKGINRPIEFRGLKAQYIWYLGVGVVVLFILFAILYILGVNSFTCIAIVVFFTFGLFAGVYRLSNKYGEYGLMKKAAQRRVPPVITIRSRKIFMFKKGQ